MMKHGYAPIAPTWLGRGSSYNLDANLGSAFLVFSVICAFLGGSLPLIFHESVGGAHSQGALESLIHFWHPMGLLYLGLTPALLQGFGLWLLPVLVRSQSMAFSALNRLSFGFMLGSGGAYFLGFFPYWAFDAIVVSLFLWSASVFCYALSVFITVLNMRPLGMTLSEIPVFVWAQWLASLVLGISIPVFVAAQSLVLWQTPSLSMGIDKFQVLMSHYTYPVMIFLLLPVLGISVHVVQTFCGVLKARGVILAAFLVLAFLGSFGWVNWVFHTGYLSTVHKDLFFAASGYVMLGATGAVIYAMALTLLWKKPVLHVPLLWVIGVMAMIVLAWPIFVLAGKQQQVHSVLAYSSVFAAFAGFYLWIGKIRGRNFSGLLAILHFSLTLTGVLVNFEDQLTCITNASAPFATQTPMLFANFCIGKLISDSAFGLSLLVFAFIVLQCIWGKKRITEKNYWVSPLPTGEWCVSTPFRGSLQEWDRK
ncbi:cbb3-type cytochrome c oxidase subunit I [Entomobacter blattae]|uniref:Cytochrome c oxidase subunit 1-beta n=1 Tax=Entomobacter blattae TaxID=2762277 RepID=A0A7H1NRT4_9PROT|nr:cbb3-type cytochrome c oxidase subunit I [Entomobacter blattae]QNT78494.1 Cytochrome c oxidase subunit 1-beta [Entomobacter blattae]